MNARRLLWLRIAVFIAALVPLARLFVLGYQGELSANPIEFVTRSTGIWTMVFVCITLAVTPLRRLTGWGWLIRLRRMIGLYAFFYGCAHFMTYLWFDQWFDWGQIVLDIIKRPYITAGFVAFVAMVPLALTSTHWSMRKLGRRWGVLHRLVYLTGLAGILHFWWHKAGKNDFFEPSIYGAIVIVLLALRIYWARQKTTQAKAKADGGSGEQAFAGK